MIESRLTIVHVLTRLLRAGSEENTLHSCRAQAAAGHRVVLVHGREFEAGVADRAREVCEVVAAEELVHPLSPAADVRAVRQLRRLFEDLGADVVHTHQSKAGVLGRIAAKLAGVDLIIHTVHILPWESVGPAKASLYVAAERICAGFTDAFISVSPSVRQSCLDRGISDPDRHFVAFSAMPVERFKTAETPVDADELLGLVPGEARPPVAVMLAAFEPRKRQAEVVRALPEAFAGQADWRVVFAGEGPEEAATKALVRELGLERQVRFAGYRSDPERVIALGDVCFLTSEREGLPRVVVQYAAAGKPIVASALPGLSDVLPDDGAAIVTDAEDVPAAVRAVAGLLADPLARARLAEGASRVAVDRWSPENMALSVDAAYRAGEAYRGRRSSRGRPAPAPASEAADVPKVESRTAEGEALA